MSMGTKRRVCDNLLHNVTWPSLLWYATTLHWHDRYGWELGPNDASVVGATYLFLYLLHRFI